MAIDQMTVWDGLIVPTRSDPANFPARGDDMMSRFPLFQTQINTISGQFNATAIAVAAAQVAAEAAATAASGSATAAAASATAAAVTAGAAPFVAATSYAQYAAAISLVDFQTYRRKVAGVNATDPANDPTNWQLIPILRMTRSVRSSNTQLTANDHGSIIDYSAGGFTQTYAACSALGNGWWVLATMRPGISDITHDPNGSELIDDVTSGIQKAGMALLIQCNGSNLMVTRLDCTPITVTHTTGTSGSLPLGVKAFKTEQSAAGGGGGRSATGARAGGGGGGGYARKTHAVAAGVKTYSYALGAPGPGATVDGTAGAAAGATSFTYNAATVTTNGGQGGAADSTGVALGGTAAGGDLNVRGGHGYVINTSQQVSVNGGNPLSVTHYSSNAFSPAAAEGFGSGGDGAPSGANGTAGAPAVIYVEF